MKLNLPNETASNLEEVSRHYCEEYDINKEMLTTLNFLVHQYIESHPEAFEQKGENQYVYVDESPAGGGNTS